MTLSMPVLWMRWLQGMTLPVVRMARGGKNMTLLARSVDEQLHRQVPIGGCKNRSVPSADALTTCMWRWRCIGLHRSVAHPELRVMSTFGPAPCQLPCLPSHGCLAQLGSAQLAASPAHLSQAVV